jgi:hypothetical protein
MKKNILVIILFTLALAEIPASASSILDLRVGDRGEINYWRSGPGAALWGFYIKVPDLTYGAEALPVNGRMFFSTGDLSHFNSTEWFFGSGGKITVSGCVDRNLDHDTKCGDKGDFYGTLLTGTFLNAHIANEKNGTKMMEAQFLDQINPQLAAYLGMPTTSKLYKGEMELAFSDRQRAISPRSLWRARIYGGYVKPLAVPEPASIFLLGAGLAAFGGMRLKFIRTLG